MSAVRTRKACSCSRGVEKFQIIRITFNKVIVLTHGDALMTAVLFPGENCDTLQYSKNVQEKESENYGSMAAGVVVALILVAIIVALLFYYRRRVANLKTEIAHVQYIADPQAAPGDAEHILSKLVTLCALFYESLG
jgi:hypothetical protein